MTMKTILPFFLALLIPVSGQAQISGFRAESLTLANGEVLSDVEVKGVSPTGVIIQHGRNLTTLSPALLPENLEAMARDEIAQLPERTPAAPGPIPEGPTFKERRWAEIEANREAERQVAIESAKGLAQAAALSSAQAGPFIEWNDLKLSSPEFGVGYGTAIIENTGRTSRDLSAWDLKVVYSDGVTRSVRMLRPFRLDRDTRTQVTFYYYDRYRATPLYLRWHYKRDLLPVQRNFVETKTYVRGRPYRRPYYRD
jgi:hypothetical protein